MAPTSVSNLGPSGSVSPSLGITFQPTSPTAYPATVTLATTDALCTALPSPIQLTGTGTQGKVSVSATTLTFGTDTNDPSGLVNCGATGPARTFTVSNVGNQQFNITGLSLGLGASSPYVLSGDATTLPATIPIGGSTTMTLTPKAIPAAVANPNDASPFTDTLTVTTDAALDSPHKIALVMQARGAVIASTPLATSWSFGTLGNGLIGTFSNTITNTGNAAASVSFQGLQHPTVFGLQNAPTTVAANGVTDIVGQFSPPATNQVWTDQGTLVVTAAQAFCEPLPSSWSSPTITLSGSSIAGSLPVTVSGSLAFPSTPCGSAAPAAQAITLTNTTNVAYEFTARLNSGAFYTLQNPTMGDASAGIIPGNGVVVLGVTPQTVTPGPSAVAGSAPYADDLVVSIQSPTPSGVTIPISWTLDGAMLSLPQGLGPEQGRGQQPVLRRRQPERVHAADGQRRHRHGDGRGRDPAERRIQLLACSARVRGAEHPRPPAPCQLGVGRDVPFADLRVSHLPLLRPRVPAVSIRASQHSILRRDFLTSGARARDSRGGTHGQQSTDPRRFNGPPRGGGTDLPLDHALSLLLADETENALRWGAAVLESGPWTPSALVVTARLLDQMGRRRAAVEGLKLAVQQAIAEGNLPLATAAVGDLRALGADVAEPLDQVAAAFCEGSDRLRDSQTAPLLPQLGEFRPLSPFLTGPALASKAAQIVESVRRTEPGAGDEARRGSPRCRSSAPSGRRLSTTCSRRSTR